MKELIREKDRAAVSFPGGCVVSAILTAASLGVAAWALQSAKWLSPNPPFLLILILGVALSTLLALKRMSQGLSISLFFLVGLAVAIWQSVTALPSTPSLNLWSQWLGALAKPAGDPTLFIALLALITWLVGVFGAWYAVRRRNGWVSFALGCLLVILNIINLPREFTYVLPLYLALALVLIIQVSWLKSQGKTSKFSYVGRIIPGFALCLVVVIVAFALPQSPAENFSLGIDGGAVYSSIKNNALNIFQAVPSKVKTILSSSQDTVSFNGAANTDDTVKFIIDTATPGYFATRYYDTYSAAGWSNSPLIDGNLLANQAIEDAVQTTSSILARYEVENEVKTDLILVNGRPESISVPTLTRSLPAPTGIDISSLVSSKMLSPYTPYTVNTRITKASANDLAKANTPYPEWITQRYLQLPTSLPRSIKSLSQQLTISFGRQLSEYEKVEAIEKYLQNFTYNINGTVVPVNTDGVAAFLSAKEGNCVNFASALVVMLRSVGVPARFVQGYLGSDVDPDGKHLLIHGRNSHAWVEVYFPDFGWIVAEATPGSPSDNFSGLTTTSPDQTVQPGTVVSPVPPSGEIIDNDTTGPAGTLPDNGKPTSPMPWLVISLLAGLVICGGGGTLYLTRTSTPKGAYIRLGWLGKVFQTPRKPTDTPLEYALRLRQQLPDEALEIAFIANTFAYSLYSSSKGIDRTQKTELSTVWKNLSLKLMKRRLGF